MRDNHIQQVEAKLEKLVEGVFNRLFHRGVNAHDIALSIGRAMASHLRMQGDDARPIAPSVYRVGLNPHTLSQLASRRAELEHVLGEYVVELATSSGYRLLDAPFVDWEEVGDLRVHEVRVEAHHSANLRQRTEAMQAIQLEPSIPSKVQLVIHGRRSVILDKTLITIGRATDNDIVIDDDYLSRYHLQLRARDGIYMLFDIQSKSGTLVNNIPVREHRLQSGDVIEIGQSRLVYMTDNHQDDEPPSTTSSLDVVDV